ncbi:uncharacterized protein LOC134220510 [Armigeres subalbatus]|uniref:uncharacterized protein LOC134220510 n=1 Tax=Armigeres subalbatus TaxID=124917 RepID=UPI002ED0071E
MKFFNVLLFISIKQILGQYLEINDLHHNPLLMLKEQNCYIQTGIIKILHPINLTMLEINVALFLEFSRKIDQDLPMSNLILRKSRQLADNLYKLKPVRRNRHKRWDSIGKGWKWLAGTPDADDLRIINSTFNALVDQSNEQIKINRVINERISKITNTVNQLTSVNNILLKETDAITLLLSLDTMNNILEEIEDAILRARVSLSNRQPESPRKRKEFFPNRTRTFDLTPRRNYVMAHRHRPTSTDQTDRSAIKESDHTSKVQ